ncbi:MAG: hypothetical protein ACR2JB_03790 [Bryobacteraceae bacterium]
MLSVSANHRNDREGEIDITTWINFQIAVREIPEGFAGLRKRPDIIKGHHRRCHSAGGHFHGAETQGDQQFLLSCGGVRCLGVVGAALFASNVLTIHLVGLTASGYNEGLVWGNCCCGRARGGVQCESRGRTELKSLAAEAQASVRRAHLQWSKSVLTTTGPRRLIAATQLLDLQDVAEKMRLVL